MNEDRFMRVIIALVGVGTGMLISSGLWQSLGSPSSRICLIFGAIGSVILICATHSDWF
jgi:hypothetical protein